MITICGLEFPNYEDEYMLIKSDTIFRCHPQLVTEEHYGVPLRVTAGYQCFYDKKLRTFQGLTFYAPVMMPDDYSYDKIDPSGVPHPNFSYVLASFDGKLQLVNGELCLTNGSKALLYNHFSPTKTTGNVKKGAIIGKVGRVPGGYGYGVSVRGFKGGNIWDIQRDLYNIRCIE